jgi:hypothetical protein
LLLHLLQFLVVPGITVLYNPGLPFSVYAWGLTQFLYLGPAVWLAYRWGWRKTAKGLLIVAGIGVLLNGACDALVLKALSRRG